MTKNDLLAKIASSGTKDVLTESEITEALMELPEWILDDDGRLITNLEFENFVSALAIVNDIGYLAEEEGHHPDILIYDYKNVGISLSTHDAENQLTLADFILAAKIDELLEGITEEESE